MRKFKKVVSAALVAAMTMSLVAGCGNSGQSAAGSTATANAGGSGDVEGAHVFMFKSTGNSFGDLMFEGFEEYMTAKGEKAVYKSPAETTVAAQVQMLDELITQKVASITISTNGDAGYDEVFKKAKDAGIQIVSVDSEANPDYRVCHVNQAESADIGAGLVRAAVLITLGIDYPEGSDDNMAAAIKEALASYSGDEINLGVLSAGIDTPVQNGWIADMEAELADPIYAGKVSATLDKKYGNDDPTESTTQANAFVAEDKVDCIISPTTVGIASAGQVLKSSDSKIKLTGLGIPSEMQSFMPSKASDDAFKSVCPYMMLWDVVHLGAVAGAASYAAYKDGFDGAVGSSFTMDAFGDYDETSYEAYQSGDGTAVLAGNPYVFYKGNIEEWVKAL
ncbi:MAG: substrate-binding domain-containing protein [Hespellia sp.]|nr:substrate-binding domain-containing protein [Hespellia sp.]